MEIQINRTKNKKLVIDEASSIITSYKKLLLNPHKKILKMSTRLIFSSIVLSIYLLLLILYTCTFSTNIIFPILIGISTSLLILVIIRLIIYINNLNNNSKINSNSILIIDKDKVLLDKKSISCYIEWDNIKNILITNNCIVFMKNSFSKRDFNSIIISRDYESEVIEALKNYNKLDLLIYNKR